jgi:hypothetical protein
MLYDFLLRFVLDDYNSNIYYYKFYRIYWENIYISTSIL